MFLNSENPDKAFQKINLLHMASLIIQIVLIVIVHFMIENKESFQISDQQTIIYTQYIFLLIAMATIPLSEYSIKQKLKKILQMPDKTERFELYLTVLIMKLALIEFINIAAIVVYFLSGHKTFLYISVILALFFLMSRPGKDKIMNDLNM